MVGGYLTYMSGGARSKKGGEVIRVWGRKKEEAGERTPAGQVGIFVRTELVWELIDVIFFLNVGITD